MRHEPVQLGQAQLRERAVGLLRRALEFQIPRLELLHAFDIGGDPVGGLQFARRLETLREGRAPGGVVAQVHEPLVGEGETDLLAVGRH